MDLLSFVSLNPTDNEHFVCEKTIDSIYEQIDLLNSIRGFTINVNHVVSFNGHKYTNFISNITNNECDLYMTLGPTECKHIYNKLLNIAKNNAFESDIWKHSYFSWFKHFTEDYIASPKEIHALTILFKIIVQQQLFIHPGY